jgi:NhaA family Na+:H+ antiporter
LLGAACVCGIGFSESVFFADAAFAGTELLAISKISVFIGSITAATLGWLVLCGGRADGEQTALG